MIEIALAGLFGLVIGSFLNVCIYRWPRELSVVRPGSHCTSCGHRIGWRDNIPLFSYALLGGRCRHCLARFSWRYPAVEAVTGVLFAAGVWMWGPTAAAAKFALFAALQMGTIVSDLETRLLPDEFTKGGMLLGLLTATLVPMPGPTLAVVASPLPDRVASVIHSLAAAAVLSGSLWLVGWVYSKLRHREGLGFGDVKLVAMIGTFLGITPGLASIFFGCVSGAILGVAYAWITKKEIASYQLPFGSFLGAASLVVALMNR